MTRLLTSTAVGLIAAFAVQAQAQDSNNQTAQMDDPCTAQWVSVDANNDGTISESEAQGAIDAQFSEIDEDGDSMVSVKEWKDCTAPSAIPGGFQSAEGTGTERTPAGTADSGQQGTAGQALSSGSDQEGTAGQALSSDSDQEGTAGQALSSDSGQQGTESTRALQTPQTGETPADWSEEQFGEMDTDHSGYVTAEEAGEWTRNRVTAETDDEETLGRYGAMFSMMDMDSDGRISEQEWQARDQMTVEDRFGRVDQDGDDQVSLEEWRDYREQRFEQARQDMQQQGQEQTQGQDEQQAQDQQQAQTEAGEEPTLWLYYFRSL